MPDPIGNRPIFNSKIFRYHTSQILGTIFLICHSILNLFQPFKAIQHNSFRDPSLLWILWILDWIYLRLIQWKSFERHNKFRGGGLTKHFWNWAIGTLPLNHGHIPRFFAFSEKKSLLKKDPPPWKITF